MTISTIIFDFGGVISSPLFVGIGAFEEAEGWARRLGLSDVERLPIPVGIVAWKPAARA